MKLEIRKSIFENTLREYFSFSVNPCGLEPCKNGAKCFNHKDTFKCICTAGFMGPTCIERKCIFSKILQSY